MLKKYLSLIDSKIIQPHPDQVILAQRLASIQESLVRNREAVTKYNSSFYNTLHRALTGEKFIVSGSERNKNIENGQGKNSIFSHTVDSQLSGEVTKGLFIYGNVGCGKTYMMDMFVSTLNQEVSGKPITCKRVHFHSFLLDIHVKIHQLRQNDKNKISKEANKVSSLISTGNSDDNNNNSHDVTETSLNKSNIDKVNTTNNNHSNTNTKGDSKDENNGYNAPYKFNIKKPKSLDPLLVIGKEIAKKYKVLCLDEFQVSDVADAMIIKRLFEGIFNEGGIMIATSNRSPDDLYQNGLNRHLFLPFIHLLKQKCDILQMQKANDFRLESLPSKTESSYYHHRHHHRHQHHGRSSDDVVEDTAVSKREVNNNNVVRAFYNAYKKECEGFIEKEIDIPIMMGRSLRVTGCQKFNHDKNTSALSNDSYNNNNNNVNLPNNGININNYSMSHVQKAPKSDTGTINPYNRFLNQDVDGDTNDRKAGHGVVDHYDCTIAPPGNISFNNSLSTASTTEDVPNGCDISPRSLVVKIDFDKLCKNNLGASDYKGLCSKATHVYIYNLHCLDKNELDTARRLITLIDIAYDSKTKLILLSSCSMTDLFINISIGKKDTLINNVNNNNNNFGEPNATALKKKSPEMTIKKGGGASSSVMSTFIGEMEWSATGLNSSLAELHGQNEDVRFAVNRAFSRLFEMGSIAWESASLNRLDQN